MVSIIIPVYKSEQTLKRCIESVLMQDYEDFEIIMVVDGPPDGSGILAERLALTDSRIRVINQSNQGVSRARNKGIKEAKGDYIRFLDSDDYLKQGALRSMVEAIEREQSDLVIAGFHHLYYGQSITKLPKEEGTFETGNAYEVMRQLYIDGFLNMPWNKLFKKELILQGFPVEINLGEDLMFNQTYIRNAKRITVVRSCVCEYVQDDRGTTLSTKKRDDKIEMALFLYQESLAFFQSLYPKRKHFSFLDTKVVTTFLDDLELLGFAKESFLSRRKTICVYRDALIDFLDKEEPVKISLDLLDYKLIYFFFRRGFVGMTDFLIVTRAVVVKLVRRKKGHASAAEA